MSQSISDFRNGRPFGDGTDSDLTISSDTAFGAGTSCSGTSGAKTLTLGAAGSFANNDLVLIHQSRGTGVGAWEINKIASGGGTTTLTLQDNLTNTYTDSGASQAQAIRLLEYVDVTVNSGKTWSVPAWDGDKGGILAFAARGTVTITGTISANGKGYVGGTSTNETGEGTVGTKTTGTTNNGSGGGSGYTASGAGSGGGNGTAGQSVDSTGGVVSGSADLTTITFGGGGGTGNNGIGGAGAGIIIIFSKTITIAGGLTLTGTNGGTGIDWGGGAGAGGSILIKCQNATLGTTKLTASGGTGGASTAPRHSGGAGGAGRIRLDYSSSYTGTTTPDISASQDKTLLESDASFLLNLT